MQITRNVFYPFYLVLFLRLEIPKGEEDVPLSCFLYDTWYIIYKSSLNHLVDPETW
jgi:hypothetical protein